MESFDWTNLVFQIHSSVPDSSKEIVGIRLIEFALVHRGV